MKITPLLKAVQVNLVQPKSQLLANSQKQGERILIATSIGKTDCNNPEHIAILFE